ncbi:MAG: hypothetical protein ACR2H3_02155 [Acidimicrobiales bacterium]
MPIEKRKGSSLAVADTAVLVFAVVVAGFIALKVLGWIVGTVIFLVKVAVFAVIVAVIVGAVSRIRRR